MRHIASVPQDISDTINFRPNPEDKELMYRLMAKLGLNYTSLIRLSLRRLAEAEGFVSNAAD